MLKKIASYFNNVTKSKEITVKEEVVHVSNPYLSWILRYSGGGVSAQQAMDLYRQASAVTTAVEILAKSLEQITPRLKSEDGKLSEFNNVNDLLKHPNGFETFREFIGGMARHYLLTGNCHIIALGNINRPPIELYNVKPQNVNTQESMEDGFPISYSVWNGVGKGNYQRRPGRLDVTRFYASNLKEFYHIMGFSSESSNIHGDSPLAAIALEVQQQIKSKAHNLKIIDDGGRLSLIVGIKDAEYLEPEQWQEVKKTIRSDLQSNGIAIIKSADVNIKEASVSAKDMDYKGMDEVARHATYLRYGVPLPLVTTDASTFDNIVNATLTMYDHAILPLVNTLYAGLSKMLLPRFGYDLKKFSISYDPNSITALMSRRINEIRKLADLGFQTQNELRAMMPNLEPVEGGDEIFITKDRLPINPVKRKDYEVTDGTQSTG